MSRLFRFLSVPVFALLLFVSSTQAAAFTSARPVWPTGLEKEYNVFAGFRAEFTLPDSPAALHDTNALLRLTSSAFYRVYLNGEFLARGPARGPHGFYRVDEWDMGSLLRPGVNVVAIEVAGYNANGYGVLAQPSFLQAEVIVNGKVVAATGADAVKNFSGRLLDERVQKVQRYTIQRAFIEVYRLNPQSGNWKQLSATPAQPETPCTVQQDKNHIPRRVAYPAFIKRYPLWDVCAGTVKTDVQPEEPWDYRSLTQVGPTLNGFVEKDLDVVISREYHRIVNDKVEPVDKPFDDKPLELGAKEFRILDLGTNYTGFVGATVTVRENTRLFVTFDEELTDGDVDFLRLNCVNAVTYEMAPGTYKLESFEPYTMRYLKFTIVEGSCEVGNIYLREYVNPEAENAAFTSSDIRLNRLFQAGRETFRQNATDIFMDCPSRERAGWLCDSYFTARAALSLSGNTTIEHNFFENFALPDSFEYLPEGMLPMCYPSDHYKGTYLPTWAIWFVIQLEEYAQRSGDAETIQALREKVLKLFDFFAPFENSDGLLERLDGWVILEWSAMNDFVNDVNYPINMLYAMSLDAAANIYGLPQLAVKAENIRGVIREQSFNGEFFVDNAVRENGTLTPTSNSTETCQYYAFLSGVATEDSHPELLAKLVNEFSPGRIEAGRYTDIHTITPFIGFPLRLDFLCGRAPGSQVAHEALELYYHMVEQHGTLWEMDYPTSSRNHGFQSHVCCDLIRSVLGLIEIDTQGKKAAVRFSDTDLEWCRGTIPVPDGEISLSWRTEGGKILYQLTSPPQYEVTVRNDSGMEIERKP